MITTDCDCFLIINLIKASNILKLKIVAFVFRNTKQNKKNFIISENYVKTHGDWLNES